MRLIASGLASANPLFKLVIHDNPDGKYLIKGGGPDVWRRFCIRKEDRRSQGIIHSKRCGTTENIGLATRARWNEQQVRCNAVAVMGDWIDPSSTSIGHAA